MYKLDDEKLDEKQQRAIFLLVEGKTSSEVANEIGVHRSTIYRWKTEDAIFITELNRLKESLWQATQTKLLQARAEAIDELIALLNHEDAKIKVKAIEIILKEGKPIGIGPTTIKSAQDRITLNKYYNDKNVCN